MEAASDPSDQVVPKVHLHATAKEALRDVDFKDLNKYGAEGEAGGEQSGGSLRGMAGVPKRQKTESPNKTGGMAKDAHPDESDDQDQTTHGKMFRGERGDGRGT
jgi:hypothetical protein